MIRDSLLNEIELGSRVADALEPINNQETAMETIDFNKVAGMIDALARHIAPDRTEGYEKAQSEHLTDAFFDLMDAALSVRCAVRDECDEEITPPAREATVQMPEPTGWLDCLGDDDRDAATPYWHPAGRQDRSVVAWINGVDIDGTGPEEDLNGIREYALAVLAAVEQVEKWQEPSMIEIDVEAVA